MGSVENLRTSKEPTNPVEAVYSFALSSRVKKETINSKKIELVAAQSNRSGKVTDGNIYVSASKQSSTRTKSLGRTGVALSCDATHSAGQPAGGYPGLAVDDAVQFNG